MAQNKMIQFAMNLINRNPQIANNPMALRGSGSVCGRISARQV